MTAHPILPPIPAVEPSDATAEIIPRYTVAQYLEMERTAATRHEYVDGRIVAMAGETLTHNRIARNISVRLETAFGERPCETFIENVKVRVSSTRYRYPDVVALCGEAQVDNAKPPNLLNPAVIIEVLSPSTEASDRDEKFLEYRQLASVTDYVLVAQDKIEVTHFARQSLNHWIVTIYTDQEDALTFASLNETLALKDIYRKIVFWHRLRQMILPRKFAQRTTDMVQKRRLRVHYLTQVACKRAQSM